MNSTSYVQSINKIYLFSTHYWGPVVQNKIYPWSVVQAADQAADRPIFASQVWEFVLEPLLRGIMFDCTTGPLSW